MADIQNHINSNTTVNPKTSDICKLKVRGENLAFKVTVPKNKLNEVIAKSIWDENITAELYNPQKQKLRTPKGVQSNGNNKHLNNNQTFRKQGSHPHKPIRPHRPNYHSNNSSLPSRDQAYIPYSQHVPTHRQDETRPPHNSEWARYSYFSEPYQFRYGYQY